MRLHSLCNFILPLFPVFFDMANRTRLLANSRLIITLGCLFFVNCAQAAVRLPHVFGDHMVLQRDKEINLWGWASPGEKIKARFAGQEAEATADASGEWKVKLPAMAAGGPHEMTVTGENALRISDILIGEVWVCSGQSNMEFDLARARNGREEIKNADYPQIRMLHVPRASAGLPVNDVNARWFVCSPTSANLPKFSAVGYFFGREIHQAVKVPVGLIAASQAGTPIEPWTAPEGLADVPALRSSLPGIEAAADHCRKKLGENLDALEAAIPRARAALALGKPLPPEMIMGSPLPPDGVPHLYNGMIHPLVPYAIRGALWYQGESNRRDGMLYFEKMKALVGGWRSVWQQGDFPFYFVQITPNTYNGALPLLLEAQAASMSIPNTGMAQTTDTCGPADHFGGGHPNNKQEVGRRLALWALAKDYGQTSLVHSGPRYQSMKVEGNRLRIAFDSVGGGLVTRDGKAPDSFEISGADGNYVEAAAVIDGPTVVLSSEKVPLPVAMRFAWKDLAQPNLMNKEGLPVSVFRAAAR